MRDYVLYTNQENATIMWTRGIGRTTAGHYYEMGETMTTDDYGKSLVFNNDKVYFSTIPNDKRVIGFLGEIKENVPISNTDVSHTHVAYTISIGDSKHWEYGTTPEERKQTITGFNVCNEGGAIEIGDFITTSSTPGYFMKQSDDIVHSYTGGRSLENVTFDSNDIKTGVYGIMMCG